MEAAPACLTIAGHDPSGLAGATADLRTFASAGVRGVSLLTALTVQTPDRFDDCRPVEEGLLARQFEALIGWLGPVPAKIGLIASAGSARLLLRLLSRLEAAPVVLDPVASPSAAPQRRFAHWRELLPAATVLTPNAPEAEELLGRRLEEPADLEEAARDLEAAHGCSVLVKGGHLPRGACDVLSHRGKATVLPFERSEEGPVHGSGCFLSASLAAHLARGLPLEEAARRACAHAARAWSRPRLLGGFPALEAAAPEGSP